jgi:hypothetical protein
VYSKTKRARVVANVPLPYLRNALIAFLPIILRKLLGKYTRKLSLLEIYPRIISKYR